MPVKLALKQSSPNLEIVHDDEGKQWEVCFKQIADLIKLQLKFEAGVEFDEKLPFSASNKSVGVVDGEDLKITSKTPKGELVRTFTVKEEGKELEIVRILVVSCNSPF